MAVNLSDVGQLRAAYLATQAELAQAQAQLQEIRSAADIGAGSRGERHQSSSGVSPFLVRKAAAAHFNRSGHSVGRAADPYGGGAHFARRYASADRPAPNDSHRSWAASVLSRARNTAAALTRSAPSRDAAGQRRRRPPLAHPARGYAAQKNPEALPLPGRLPVPDWRQCRAPPDPIDICERCANLSYAAAAGSGAAAAFPAALAESPAALCRTGYKWQWDVSAAELEASNFVTGLRTVSGVKAANEAGVEVVATVEQSNWPALIKEGRSMVRAASEEHKQRLCSLWRHVQNQLPMATDREVIYDSYISWPLLLGCQGFRHREYEPLCRNTATVVRVPCGLIDFAIQDAQIKCGAVYDATRWYRVDQSRWPPAPCRSRHLIHMRSVGVAISVYPEAVGHFVPEQLPKILLLNRTLPAGVPILAIESRTSSRYLAPLFDSGALSRDRILLKPLADLHLATISADSVFTLANSHFSGPTEGDATFRLARVSYGGGSVPLESRPYVLLVDRGLSARRISNVPALRAAIAAVIAAHPDPRARLLTIRDWRPGKLVSDDISAWRHAAVVVAPHGAGLGNLLFASEGTPVIEICFDRATFQSRMACPPMYGMMGAALGLPYFVVTGSGGYTTPIEADLPQVARA